MHITAWMHNELRHRSGRWRERLQRGRGRGYDGPGGDKLSTDHSKLGEARRTATREWARGTEGEEKLFARNSNCVLKRLAFDEHCKKIRRYKREVETGNIGGKGREHKESHDTASPQYLLVQATPDTTTRTKTKPAACSDGMHPVAKQQSPAPPRAFHPAAREWQRVLLPGPGCRRAGAHDSDLLSRCFGS
eukprot:5867875-Pleurochrysis_carterae.AAC.2